MALKIIGALLIAISLVSCQPSSNWFAGLNGILQDAGTTPTSITISPTQTIHISETQIILPTTTPAPATPVPASEITHVKTLPPTPLILGLGNTPANLNPLTGLPVPNPEILERRPVFVKISNFPARGSRPQAGLSFADIVFEYYIGEGMNRFLAVYYGQDTEKAWPLRSGRLVDAQLVNMYHGVLVYGNADPDKVDNVLLEELGDRAVSFDDAACPAICGIETHSETGVYVNTAEITAFTSRIGVKNTRFPLEGMVFRNNQPESAVPANQIDINFTTWNRSEWFFDPATGKYLRWTELWDNQRDDAWDDHPMIPHIESLTGEQLSFSNIVILFAYYDEYAPTLHNIEIWDSPEKHTAYYFRDGVMIEGSWRAPKHDQPFQFINQNGVPVALKPGNTWITITDYSSPFSKIEEGHWQVQFEIP